MAGKSARFGLRDRPPTPAIRRFDLPPRLKPMLDRANAGLAEPFRGITSSGGVVPGSSGWERPAFRLRLSQKPREPSSRRSPPNSARGHALRSATRHGGCGRTFTPG